MSCFGLIFLKYISDTFEERHAAVLAEWGGEAAEDRDEYTAGRGPRGWSGLMAVFPRRYGIYFADLNPTVGGELRKVQPVVVVSQNERNRFLDTVVVCPITSTLHPQWRSRLQIPCAGKTAEIAVDRIRTIGKQRLRRRLDRLSSEHAAQLRRIITEMYGE